MSDADDTLAATKLTRTEFAVVRAYAQGMRPVDIANRYLADPDDDALTESQAVARILTLRDRLVQFALQHDRPDIAAMFEALRGRSDVGMDRRVEALSSLEKLGQGRPLGAHDVGLWFGPSLARRLSSAGILKIADLAALANERGSGWWRRVPRIGPKSAGIITGWLVRQRDAAPAGAVPWIQPHVVAPADIANRPPIIGLPPGRGMAYPVPLEHMRVDDVDAAVRADVSQVRQWVERPTRSPSTRRSYTREAERLLLWCAVNGHGLSDLDATRLEDFRVFLGSPKPSAFWCGPACPRDRAHWRPFEGPLGASSQAATMRVVNALLNGLHRSGYLPRKPARTSEIIAAAVSRPVARLQPSASPEDGASDRAGSETARTGIAPTDIAAFLAWLAQGLSHRTCVARVAADLIGQGLTLGRIVALRADALMERDGCATLAGRPLSAGASSALRAHWKARGLTPDTLAGAPLIAPQAFPATRRGLAKQATGGMAGYSATGLDQLLRAAWKDYLHSVGMTLPQLTPSQLRRPRVTG